MIYMEEEESLGDGIGTTGDWLKFSAVASNLIDAIFPMICNQNWNRLLIG